MRLLIILMMIFTIGCSADVVTYEDFKEDATDFYVLMLTVGEKTPELDEVYNEFLKYDKTDDELYINVVAMYEEMGVSTLVELYRSEVTRLINE